MNVFIHRKDIENEPDVKNQIETGSHFKDFGMLTMFSLIEQICKFGT